jgi:hypothetical protein
LPPLHSPDRCRWPAEGDWRRRCRHCRCCCRRLHSRSHPCQQPQLQAWRLPPHLLCFRRCPPCEQGRGAGECSCCRGRVSARGGAADWQAREAGRGEADTRLAGCRALHSNHANTHQRSRASSVADGCLPLPRCKAQPLEGRGKREPQRRESEGLRWRQRIGLKSKIA